MRHNSANAILNVYIVYTWFWKKKEGPSAKVFARDEIRDKMLNMVTNNLTEISYNFKLLFFTVLIS